MTRFRLFVPIDLSEIRAARKRIATTTRCVRHSLGWAGPGFPEVRLKLENLQPIGDLQITRGGERGRSASQKAERARGVWTRSQRGGTPGSRCGLRRTPGRGPVQRGRDRNGAARRGLERMRALTAQSFFLVPYDVAWQTLDDRAFPGVDGAFIHPFDDDHFIAPVTGTMGLTRFSRTRPRPRPCSPPDPGGGGLITGIGSALKALRPEIKVIGVEPENRRARPRFPL